VNLSTPLPANPSSIIFTRVETQRTSSSRCALVEATGGADSTNLPACDGRRDNGCGDLDMTICLRSSLVVR
jgi:hypothetical protein